MASFNKVILIGNLTADVELKQTQGGLSVCSFSIAVNRRFKNEGHQDCDFITIVAWRQSTEFVCRYFKKGQPILICGQLQTRTWTDNQGQKRFATEVVADEVAFVGNNQTTEAKNDTPVFNPATADNYMPSAYTGANNQNFEEIPNNGDLPF